MYKTLMVDLSSNNPRPDLDQMWKAGFRVLCLKVSESTNYVWLESADLAKRWQHKGGIVHHYHFLRPGPGDTASTISGTNQAEWYWQHVRHLLGPADLFVVDVEVQGVDAKEVNAFIDRLHDLDPGRSGLIYGPPYFLRDHKIKPHRGWGLWLATYTAQVAFLPPGWKYWSAWQYTDHGKVPGCPSPVDVSRLHRAMIEPTLHRGDQLFAVVDLKRALHRAGYRGMSLRSNKYGSGTARAVSKFKQQQGWTRRPSGNIVGRRMWTALHKHMANS